MAKANGDSPSTNPEAEFAKAWAELGRGERTATALENHLDALESKIDELLKHAEIMNDQDKWSEELESRDSSTSAARGQTDNSKELLNRDAKDKEKV